MLKIIARGADKEDKAAKPGVGLIADLA